VTVSNPPVLPAGFELPLEPRLPRIGAIDQVASRPACPWLGFFGTADPYIPPESLAVIRDRHPDDVVVYAGADHGFLRDGSEAYHPDAAPDAWARALAFLGRHLDG